MTALRSRLRRNSTLYCIWCVLLAAALAASALANPASAQQRRVFTAADYQRAERFLGGGFNALVVGGTVQPNWLPDDRMWYRATTLAGSEFVLVNPATKTRAPAFDHARLAAALSTAAGQTFNANALPFQTIELSADSRNVTVDAAGRRFTCDVAGQRCTAAAATPAAPGRAGAAGPAGAGGGAPGRPAGGGGGGVAPGRAAGGAPAAPLTASPDGRRAVFIRDWNLWVRDVATGQDRQLTRDASPYNGYATDNAGWAGSDRAMVQWAPDSKKLITQQQDERNVGMMYLVSTNAGHPEMRGWKYPLPGDSVVAMMQRVIIDTETGAMVRLQARPDFHRGSVGDNIRMGDYAWKPDGTQVAFTSVSRDHKEITLRVADAATGVVRDVFKETSPTHYEALVQWQILWDTNEVIWFSERNDFGNLYLYNLTTGALKNEITGIRGGPVTTVVKLDTATRQMWFTAQGANAGEDPYFRHYYKVGLDGQNRVALTPDVGYHNAALSPSGKYLIDTYSQPDVPNTVAMRDANTGALVAQLEKADISRLLAAGWKPPIQIKMTANDGKTPIYGQMFVPTNLDPTRKYPIINNIYPGPQSGSVGGRTFAAVRGDKQALAELGFIVVSIDGLGTPGRAKSFEDAYYGAMGRDNTIPSQIAGMREIAARYPYIDIDRVGIWGHSGGGFATSSAMFRFPDFFDVGIAESGNHDQRIYEDDWGEQYQGLMTMGPNGRDSYYDEANQNFAQNLKGHLMLAHGTMDNNVPPNNTWVVVDALIKANKDFDLVMIPNAAHGYGAASNYMMRRRWDYFVRWLLDAEPPANYVIGGTPPGGGR